MKSGKELFVPLLVALLMPVCGVTAAVVTEEIRYLDGDTELQGHIYYDDSFAEKRPGVLVVHEWWGLDDYAKRRATMLAELGYVAFAADMYGVGKVTEHPDQAQEWMMVNASNVDGWRARANLALQQLASHEKSDSNLLAAIGYCFGGATVMQLAYTGAPVKGVASFHGSLPLPKEDEHPPIDGRVLILHGDSDPFIERDHVEKFKAALTAENADWEMVSYGGVLHSFTNPGADQHGMPALKYDAQADRRSWARLQQFFTEIFEQ